MSFYHHRMRAKKPRCLACYGLVYWRGRGFLCLTCRHVWVHRDRRPLLHNGRKGRG